MASSDENARDDLIHEIVADRYELEWKRTSDLDSKASGVTGFAGLLATLTAGIAEFLPEAHYRLLFLIPLVFFLFSVLLGLLAYWITSFVAINPDVLIREYRDRTHSDVLRTVAATTSQHTMFNYSLNQSKVRLIYGAFLMLVLATGLFFVISIVNLTM
jgi:hypothetical protein